MPYVRAWTRFKAIYSNLARTHYLLAESDQVHHGQRLGPVGSAILLEVFGGMLKHCHSSFLKHPVWQPDPCVSKQRLPVWGKQYQQGFQRQALIDNDNYYPLELADVVRFVQRRD